MKLDKLIRRYKNSESLFSLILGVLVVIVVGNQIIGFIQKKTVTKTNDNNSVENTVADQAQNEDIYTVQEGEYLYQIAQKLFNDGNLWPQIAKANNISNPDIINPDDKLIIPVIENAPVVVQEQALTPANTITSEKYTVVANDSLWKICVRAYGDGYQWPKIAKANNLKTPDLLEKGQVLVLPR